MLEWYMKAEQRIHGCAPQKLICHSTDRLIQPQLRLTHQKPITGSGKWKLNSLARRK
jgi:hypothetical protein